MILHTFTATTPSGLTLTQKRRSTVHFAVVTKTADGREFADFTRLDEVAQRLADNARKSGHYIEVTIVDAILINTERTLNF